MKSLSWKSASLLRLRTKLCLTGLADSVLNQQFLQKIVQNTGCSNMS